MKLLLAITVVNCATCASAGGLQALESFVKTVKSGRADFTQVVTAPAKEAQTARVKSSSGSFEFVRPNHFRFSYKKPYEQIIVADGQTLWLYDIDLNQVSARKQAQALGATPAALIAAAPDLRALQAEFNLTEAPQKDGLDWVVATPKARDSSLQSVAIGLRGADLAVLEILDSFGQKSTLRFSAFVANAPLPAANFEFKPPPGVDVIRQ